MYGSRSTWLLGFVLLLGPGGLDAAALQEQVSRTYDFASAHHLFGDRKRLDALELAGLRPRDDGPVLANPGTFVPSVEPNEST